MVASARNHQLPVSAVVATAALLRCYCLLLHRCFLATSVTPPLLLAYHCRWLRVVAAVLPHLLSTVAACYYCLLSRRALLCVCAEPCITGLLVPSMAGLF
ncbi:hypothetical protein ZWY2020_049192 [Hordeum vulgare]|nr:hypothetical protein ZWY2020_049192 [Hordeum vulgare]